MQFKIFILLSIIAFSYSEFADIACSGFVEFPQEESVDFSQIEIHLFNEDKKLMDRTICSDNGFYLLPIYDSRTYILRVVSPDNLVFTPKEIKFDLDGKSELEIRKIFEMMHNFKFSGFLIKNKVTILDNEKLGPEGIKVGLYSSNGTKIGETKTITDGIFTFDNLSIGVYEITAYESIDQEYFLTKEKHMKCEISYNKAISCTGKIVVGGFSFFGKLMNENNNLEGFHIFLYEKETTGKSVECLENKIIDEHPLKSEKKYICYTVSNNAGEFLFRNVMIGQYLLYVKSYDSDKKIEIEPPFQEIEIINNVIRKTLNFDVKKFSIHGKVVDNNDKGISNVKISLDGEEKAITDKEGLYLLEKIKTGTYTLEGIHDHLFFEPIHDLKLSVDLKSVPNLYLSYLHICGRVILNFENILPEDVQDFQKFKITIYLESKTEKRTTVPDLTGNFCFEVKQGKYSIYPIVNNLEKGKEITLSPKKYSLDIINQPILDINFYRPKVSIGGKVEFLKGVDKNLISQTKLSLNSLTKKFQQEVNIDNEGNFIFNNVLSGNYDLQITNNDLCWKQNKQSIEITQNNNITDLFFSQIGFSLRYESSQQIKANLINPKNNSKEIVFLSENTNLCVDEPGIYKIIPNECFLFKEKEFVYSTTANQKILLLPIKVLIKGKLIFECGRILKSNPDLMEFLKSSIIQNNYLIAESNEQDGQIEKEEIKIRYDSIDENKNLIFSYNYYVKSYSKNIIKAEIKKNIKYEEKNNNIASFLENLMFNPASRSIKIEQNCILENNDFEIRSGLIIQGKIIPENLSENVNITIYKEFEENKLEYLQSVLVKKGVFRLGPFIDSQKYKVEGFKENFKFSQTTETIDNFINIVLTAQKLSTLKIKINDIHGNSIPNVLIYISSTSKTNMMRLNNYTNDNGIFMSNNFVKGEYLIKTVLKEYVFNPLQKTVKIVDGIHEEINVIGTKVAFSIFGKVTKLNHDPVSNAQIDVFEIIDKNNIEVENAKTNQNGLFRVKGLIPNKKYNITLKQQENFNYYKPNYVIVDMKNQDLNDVEFIVFDKKIKNTITGNIEFDSKISKEDLEDISITDVDIFLSSDQTTPLDIKKIYFNKYFEFEDLDQDDYIVKLTFKRRKNSLPIEMIKTYNFKTSEKGITIHKKFVIEKQVQDIKKEASNFSLLGPIIILILVISLLNLDKTQEILGKIIGEFRKEPVEIGKKKK